MRGAVLADLHCHLPMQLLARDPDEALARMAAVRPRPRWVDRLRALVIRLAARRLNFAEGTNEWRVTLDGLERAGAGLVLSVLYQPFAEIDLDEPYGADPEPGYVRDLLAQLEAVEAELARIDPPGRRHVVVRTATDLDAALADGRVAIVHAVEGGFHLGATPEAVHATVADLAARGVGYVTLAHLFFRGVATNTPALPFLPEGWYDKLFHQPGVGLTALGEAAVRAMHEHRVLVDLSHMRADALDATFALLDRLDAEQGLAPHEVPVIASHAGFRFGRQAYMLDAPTLRSIARRDGVVGLILARHQLQDGLRDGEGLAHTVQVVRRHVDAIHDATGSHAHVGIGSDLDGFIRPTMSGIERAEDLGGLAAPLREAYGDETAAAILGGNAARVVRRVLAAR